MTIKFTNTLKALRNQIVDTVAEWQHLDVDETNFMAREIGQLFYDYEKEILFRQPIFKKGVIKYNRITDGNTCPKEKLADLQGHWEEILGEEVKTSPKL